MPMHVMVPLLIASLIGGLLGALLLLKTPSHTFMRVVPWLMLAGVGCGLSAPGIYAFCQRIAGSDSVGRWYGPQNGFANFAGIICPALTGWVVGRTGNFFWPFAVTSAICVIGVFAWVFVVGRVEPLNWGAERSSTVVTAGVSS